MKKARIQKNQYTASPSTNRQLPLQSTSTIFLAIVGIRLLHVMVLKDFQ